MTVIGTALTTLMNSTVLLKVAGMTNSRAWMVHACHFLLAVTDRMTVLTALMRKTVPLGVGQGSSHVTTAGVFRRRHTATAMHSAVMALTNVAVSMVAAQVSCSVETGPVSLETRVVMASETAGMAQMRVDARLRLCVALVNGLVEMGVASLKQHGVMAYYTVTTTPMSTIALPDAKMMTSLAGMGHACWPISAAMVLQTVQTAQMKMAAHLVRQPAPVTSGLVPMVRVFRKRSGVTISMTVQTTLMSMNVTVVGEMNGHALMGLAYPKSHAVMANMTVWIDLTSRTAHQHQHAALMTGAVMLTAPASPKALSAMDVLSVPMALMNETVRQDVGRGSGSVRICIVSQTTSVVTGFSTALTSPMN